MPRKSPSKSVKPETPVLPFATTADTPWGGYVNLSVEEKDKPAYLAWLEMNADYMGSLLGDVVAEGVQFSLKYNPDQGSFMATLTTKPHPDIDMRCCMTTWSNTPVDAIYLSLYKWVVLLGKDMGDYRPSTSKFARWG